MAKGRWVKDSCPFAKDQGFNSVIGDVAPGEQIFGFTHTMSSTPDTLTLKTETNGLVSEMADRNYRVIATKVSTGSIAALGEPVISAKTKLSFDLDGENSTDYDLIVIGRVLY
jgi:hypothetical protein